MFKEVIYILILFLGFFINGVLAQTSQWKGITKNMDYGAFRLSVDSSSNSLLIANGFTKINGIKYYDCATWDGLKFDSLAPWSDQYPIWQIIKYKGDYYAGAYNKLLKKTGIYSWSVVGSVKGGSALGMCIYNNDLIVYGGFDSINNVQASCIAKYDGANWSQLDTIHFYTNILTAEEFQGNLYIGGNMVAKNGWCDNLGMYDGTKFVNVDNNVMAGGSSAVTTIIKYKNALYMAGNFNKGSGNPGNYLVKWDGINWDTLGGGITSGNTTIWDAMVYKNELYFVGWFTYVAGMFSPSMVKFDGNTFWGGNICPELPSVDIRGITSFQDTLYISGSFKKLCSDSALYVAKWLGSASSFTNSVSVVGVNELSKTENQIRIYPNPVSNILHIESEQYLEAGTEIEIVNTLGQTVLKLPYKNEIDVSQLSSGYYTLKITSAQHQLHSKFIKE